MKRYTNNKKHNKSIKHNITQSKSKENIQKLIKNKESNCSHTKQSKTMQHQHLLQQIIKKTKTNKTETTVAKQ